MLRDCLHPSLICGEPFVPTWTGCRHGSCLASAASRKAHTLVLQHTTRRERTTLRRGPAAWPDRAHAVRGLFTLEVHRASLEVLALLGSPGASTGRAVWARSPVAVGAWCSSQGGGPDGVIGALWAAIARLTTRCPSHTVTVPTLWSAGGAPHQRVPGPNTLGAWLCEVQRARGRYHDRSEYEQGRGTQGRCAVGPLRAQGGLRSILQSS